ncbi:hypothetical protein GJ496_003425 [Pomphorhynchus laevis]|nr:hypothetical protein GJ496_003425 [Pomphorhynchus laevis]
MQSKMPFDNNYEVIKDFYMDSNDNKISIEDMNAVIGGMFDEPSITKNSHFEDSNTTMQEFFDEASKNNVIFTDISNTTGMIYDKAGKNNMIYINSTDRARSDGLRYSKNDAHLMMNDNGISKQTDSFIPAASAIRLNSSAVPQYKYTVSKYIYSSNDNDKLVQLPNFNQSMANTVNCNDNRIPQGCLEKAAAAVFITNNYV